MDNFYLSAVVREIEREIPGRTLARVFLRKSDLLLDFRLEGGDLLLASLDPASPAFYLSGGDLPADTNSAHPFATQLRKNLAGGRLLSLTKVPLDRIIRLEFEKYDAGGERARNSLILALTGRAANAYIVDAESNQVAALTDRATLPELSDDLPTGDLSESNLLVGITDSMTEQEIIERAFGPSSIFSPSIKNEFVARARTARPADALRSIVADMVDKKPVPLVYSRLPLEEASERLINLKTDLLLSPMELAQAQGMIRNEFSNLSQAADAYYSARAGQKSLQTRFNAARQLLAQEIKKRESATRALERDRERFEDPETLKRRGDLLLSNLSTARVFGTKARVIDFYDPDQPEIEVEIQEGKSLQQSAADYFSRYQKARRALTAIAAREAVVARHLSPLKAILGRLEAEPTAQQISKARSAIEKEIGVKGQSRSGSDRKEKEKGGAAGRRFKTSDGYEVLVGRNDRENDALTFRASRPQDIWLHAADYPGSHVIIRNPRREPVPHKSIVEAAELAAFYSQAKREGKAAVHYTQRKFVSKPPRAKAGLVRLSSFKTVMVEPRCVLDRFD
ncbi:MAG TPA: NFACT family protein [Blastocatellia bacterium]|nr:NFACT family protein [Blastocatellia bacterium]